MPKLSRLQRYQVLRDRLDEETSESQQEQNKQSLQRLSRVANKDTNTLSHASDPRKASVVDNQPVQTISSNLPKSPVMDNLIDEVKQYNLDAGNTIWDDTQFNILKQLDETQARHRSQHFVPMEELEDDDLGSTMQLPITKIKAIDELAKTKKEEPKETISDEVNGPTILPMSKTPLPFYPIEEEETTENEDKEEQSEDKIVLSQEDFVEEDIESTFERLTPLEAYKRPEYVEEQDNKELAETKKQPVIKKKEKIKTESKKERTKENKKQEAKKPEKKKEKKPIIKKSTPVVKQTEVKVERSKKNKPDASHILNIVLVILIILLFIAILATVLMMRSLAA